MPLNLTDDKSTLVQVMEWCRQATSHYLIQCWPSSMSPYGVTRPQWVNACDDFQSTVTVFKKCQELRNLMAELPDYADQFLNMICKILQEYKETCHSTYKSKEEMFYVALVAIMETTILVPDLLLHLTWCNLQVPNCQRSCSGLTTKRGCQDGNPSNGCQGSSPFVSWRCDQ